MSSYSNNERFIGAEIDAMFEQTDTGTRKGRIALASAALTPFIDQLDYASLAEKNGVEQVLDLFEDDVAEQVTLFSPVEKAKLALGAQTEGVRTAYNLSGWGIMRAFAAARKKSRNTK